GAGVRPRRHPRQRGTARPNRDRTDAGVSRRAARPRREDAAPASDAAHGDPRRDRQRGGVAVLRRGRVRQRRLARRRRRLDRAMSGQVAAATALALTTALLYALSNVLKLLEAEQVPDEYAMKPSLLGQLVRR